MDLLFIPRGPDIAPEELPSPQTTGDSLPCRSTGVTKARTGLGDSKETTAKKRVVTAARREQNKQAQRAYRQRQKEQQKTKEDGEPKNPISRPLLPRETVDSSKQRAAESSNDHTDGSILNSDLDSFLDPLDDDTLTNVYQSIIGTYSRSPPEPYTADPLHSDMPSLTISTYTISPSSSPSSSSSQSISNTFADPYMNCLHFLPTTIFAACLHNARALGFDLLSLATCSVEYLSPYYCPDAKLDDDPTEMLEKKMRERLSISNTVNHQQVSTLQQSHQYRLPSQLPENLKPTIAQLLIPHHASLDLIPIPKFREQAIMLAAAMPHLFNLYELKLDIYVRGGLMPWRENNHNDITSPENDMFNIDPDPLYQDITFEVPQREARRNICEPWEESSWEAAPWFLQKWSLVVGGEKGDLGKQSEWWRIVRANRMSWGKVTS